MNISKIFHSAQQASGRIPILLLEQNFYFPVKEIEKRVIIK